MIKKISLIVIFILSICFCFTIITGCSGNEEPPHTCIFNQEVIDEDYKESGASCDKKAKYFYSCICGEKGTQTFEYGEVLGHKFISYKYDNNSECEKDGTETSICSNSGCTITNTRDVIGSAHGHKFENYSFMDNATCIQNGTEIAKCNYCDNEDERVVQHSRVEHVFYNGKCTTCRRDNYSLGLKYDKQADGNYILSGIGNCSDIDIFIPAEYSGGKVVGIKNNAFYSNEQIETIYFSENIKSIGVASFAKCKNLYFVSLNQDLEKIGNGAFSTCESLKEIIIPNNVSTIDGSAFFGCTTLRKIEIGTNVKEIKEFAFSECLNLEEIIYKAKSCNEWPTADRYIFNNCGKNKEITLTISNTVEHIPAYLFAGYNGVGYTAYNEIIIAPKIVEVIFEEDCKVRTIGQSAFFACLNLKKVYFNGTNETWEKITVYDKNNSLLLATFIFS